jgi:hypothetical protein
MNSVFSEYLKLSLNMNPSQTVNDITDGLSTLSMSELARLQVAGKDLADKAAYWLARKQRLSITETAVRNLATSAELEKVFLACELAKTLSPKEDVPEDLAAALEKPANEYLANWAKFIDPELIIRKIPERFFAHSCMKDRVMAMMVVAGAIENGIIIPPSTEEESDKYVESAKAALEAAIVEFVGTIE